MVDYYVWTTAPSSSIPSISLSKKSEEDGCDNRFLRTTPERKILVPRILEIHTIQRPGSIDRASRQRSLPNPNGFFLECTARIEFVSPLTQMLQA